MRQRGRPASCNIPPELGQVHTSHVRLWPLFTDGHIKTFPTRNAKTLISQFRVKCAPIIFIFSLISREGIEAAVAATGTPLWSKMAKLTPCKWFFTVSGPSEWHTEWNFSTDGEFVQKKNTYTALCCKILPRKTSTVWYDIYKEFIVV